MNIGMYQNAASLSALERWQDVVTQNLTSSQVTGYMRRTVQMGGMEGGETFVEGATPGSQGDGLKGYFPEARFAIAFNPGENHPTRRKLDLAIAGPGFFNLQMPDDGPIAYTRAGQFSINKERMLVSSQGFEVLSADGNPIQLLPQGGEPEILPDGSIKQGGAIVGKVGITQPEFPSRMVPLTIDLFTADDSAGMKEVEEPDVQQGYLEGSNVKPLREMVDLVNISRAYEANNKLIQTRDQLLESALEKLT
tara:strand:- start:330 stop:1082 length:753 start_codon:yes stop_codon:yes gene_type:complete